MGAGFRFDADANMKLVSSSWRERGHLPTNCPSTPICIMLDTFCLRELKSPCNAPTHNMYGAS